MGALLELTKPRITWLVVMTAAAGFALAAPGAFDAFGLRMLLRLAVGTALVAAGTNALNQWWERDADARMARTRGRPLPTGRLSAGTALLFGAGLAVSGIAHLVFAVNALTAALSALTLGLYVFVYTPLKRRTWWAVLVGAVPGALPIVGGWTAATGAAPAEAWLLFAILFLWQLPHFYALAWMYRDDYARGGFRVVSFDHSGRAVGRQVVVFASVLLALSVVPTVAGLVGTVYLVGAALAGAALLACGAMFAAGPAPRPARRLFLVSVGYLPVVLLLMVVDKVRA